jgi:5,10-methylenetetrahydromethanopterin reductase
VVATAGAVATLHAHAPGRVEMVVGSGFTAQLMLGKKPVPWAEVTRYVVALRALLRGEEIPWDGSLIGLKHGKRTGVGLPCEVPLYVAAHGPRGTAAAFEAGVGIVTNISHAAVEIDVRDAHVLYYGTVLGPGEGYDSPRVLDAAGPYAAFQLHIGELGVAAASGFEAVASSIAESRRHLEVHRGHLIEVTALERPLVTGDLVRRATGTGGFNDVCSRLAAIGEAGARGVLYGPMGDDIPRELAAFARCYSEVFGR